MASSVPELGKGGHRERRSRTPPRFANRPYALQSALTPFRGRTWYQRSGRGMRWGNWPGLLGLGALRFFCLALPSPSPALLALERRNEPLLLPASNPSVHTVQGFSPATFCTSPVKGGATLRENFPPRS